jgi:hypothetical protein
MFSQGEEQWASCDEPEFSPNTQCLTLIEAPSGTRDIPSVAPQVRPATLVTRCGCLQDMGIHHCVLIVVRGSAAVPHPFNTNYGTSC